MDEGDIANDDLERAYEKGIRRIRQAAAAMPVGEPGECVRCGEESLRLVNLVCAPCRDKFKLR